MPSPPRILLPDFPVMITTRMEEGLPLVARPIIHLILKSILARAQALFPVDVCHFLFMANHLHLILRVLDPECVASFMDYLKTESAHAVNRLLGRRKKTVWEDGYDAVPLLTLEDAIKEIAYIYTNPQKANLVSNIDHYPGFSSWSMYKSGHETYTVPRVRRIDIHPIKNFKSDKEEQGQCERILTDVSEMLSFQLSPNAWMALFGIESPDEISQVNHRIVEQIREIEAELDCLREKQGTSVIGPQKLKSQSINKSYVPKKFSKRMWCVCSDQVLRKQFIQFIKDLLARAREVTDNWRHGDFSEAFPLGLFPPRFPRLANLRPGTVFD